MGARGFVPVLCCRSLIYFFYVLLQIYVSPKKNSENGFLFQLMCPGWALNKFHEKVYMSNDGYALKNATIYDYCKEKSVRIAYNEVRIGYVF